MNNLRKKINEPRMVERLSWMLAWTSNCVLLGLSIYSLSVGIIACMVLFLGLMTGLRNSVRLEGDAFKRGLIAGGEIHMSIYGKGTK